jgi:hypothetical protein
VAGRGYFAEDFEAKERRRAVFESLDQEFYSLPEAIKRWGIKKEDGYRIIDDKIEAGEIYVIGEKGNRRISKAELVRLIEPAPSDLIRTILSGHKNS